MIRKVNLEAEDIILELTDKINRLIDFANDQEPKYPTITGKALEKAVQKTANET